MEVHCIKFKVHDVEKCILNRELLAKSREYFQKLHYIFKSESIKIVLFFL